MADKPQNLNDPEMNSEFARSKALAQTQGTAPGVDPVTGERAAVTYRQIFNETGGDEKRAREIFERVAQAGGYGKVEPNQALDIRSLDRSVDTINDALKRGVDLQGQPLDLYGRRQMEQQAQHQDNLRNSVREVLREYEKG